MKQKYNKKFLVSIDVLVRKFRNKCLHGQFSPSKTLFLNSLYQTRVINKTHMKIKPKRQNPQGKRLNESNFFKLLKLNIFGGRQRDISIQQINLKMIR